ncbi:hypothetical protein GQ54DRAFT_187016 [Martensiomyces pterosporus]|nr:hypothetical protein GQ54DRAFT_187016 [Martensiomyces pterosporus]
MTVKLFLTASAYALAISASAQAIVPGRIQAPLLPPAPTSNPTPTPPAAQTTQASSEPPLQSAASSTVPNTVSAAPAVNPQLGAPYHPYYGYGYHFPDPVTDVIRTEIYSTTDLNPYAVYESRDYTDISTVVIRPAYPTSWAGSGLPEQPTKPQAKLAVEKGDRLRKRQYFTPTTHTNIRSVAVTSTIVVAPTPVSTETDVISRLHMTTIIPPGATLPPSTMGESTAYLSVPTDANEQRQPNHKRYYGYESTLTNWISHGTYSTIVQTSNIMVEDRTYTEYWNQVVSPPSLAGSTATATATTQTGMPRILAKRYNLGPTITNSVYDVTRISSVIDPDIKTATYIVTDSVVTTIINPVRQATSTYYPPIPIRVLN